MKHLITLGVQETLVYRQARSFFSLLLHLGMDSSWLHKKSLPQIVIRHSSECATVLSSNRSRFDDILDYKLELLYKYKMIQDIKNI